MRLLFVVFLLSGVAGCGPTSDDLWARRAIQKKQEQNALIVDVRTADEYRAGHIQGAINVPHTEVKDRLSEFGNDPSYPIVVYCGKGGRAETARMILQESGYRNVWNLGSYANLAQAVAVE